MDGQQIFLSFSAFQNKYPRLTSNFLEYMGLTSAIIKSKLFLKNSENNALSFVLKQEKVCKKSLSFYQKTFYRTPKQIYREMAGNISK